MKKLLCGITVLLALSFAAFSQTKTAPKAAADPVKAIKDTEAAWVKACATKDAAKIAAFYTDDAVLIANSPTANGKEAITAAWKGLVSDPNFLLTFSSTKVVVAKSGELAWSYGTYTLNLSDPKTKKKMTDKGEFVTVFAKQTDGSWKAVADIANSDPPPAAKK